MEIQELPDKEFKTIILKMLRELQKITNNLTTSKKTIQEQNEKFSKVENKKEPNKVWS